MFDLDTYPRIRFNLGRIFHQHISVTLTWWDRDGCRLATVCDALGGVVGPEYYLSYEMTNFVFLKNNLAALGWENSQRRFSA